MNHNKSFETEQLVFPKQTKSRNVPNVFRGAFIECALHAQNSHFLQKNRSKQVLLKLALLKLLFWALFAFGHAFPGCPVCTGVTMFKRITEKNDTLKWTHLFPRRKITLKRNAKGIFTAFGSICPGITECVSILLYSFSPFILNSVKNFQSF